MTDRIFDRPVTNRPHRLGNGEQRKYQFDNGYGASVVRFTLGAGFGGSYGAEQGLWELAVLDADGHLTYSTPITDDVIGWLTEDAVEVLLQQIAALPEMARQS